MKSYRSLPGSESSKEKKELISKNLGDVLDVTEIYKEIEKKKGDNFKLSEELRETLNNWSHSMSSMALEEGRAYEYEGEVKYYSDSIAKGCSDGFDTFSDEEQEMILKLSLQNTLIKDDGKISNSLEKKSKILFSILELSSSDEFDSLFETYLSRAEFVGSIINNQHSFVSQNEIGKEAYEKIFARVGISLEDAATVMLDQLALHDQYTVNAGGFGGNSNVFNFFIYTGQSENVLKSYFKKMTTFGLETKGFTYEGTAQQVGWLSYIGLGGEEIKEDLRREFGKIPGGEEIYENILLTLIEEKSGSISNIMYLALLARGEKTSPYAGKGLSIIEKMVDNPGFINHSRDLYMAFGYTEDEYKQIIIELGIRRAGHGKFSKPMRILIEKYDIDALQTYDTLYKKKYPLGITDLETGSRKSEVATYINKLREANTTDSKNEMSNFDLNEISNLHLTTSGGKPITLSVFSYNGILYSYQDADNVIKIPQKYNKNIDNIHTVKRDLIRYYENTDNPGIIEIREGLPYKGGIAIEISKSMENMEFALQYSKNSEYTLLQRVDDVSFGGTANFQLGNGKDLVVLGDVTYKKITTVGNIPDLKRERGTYLAVGLFNKNSSGIVSYTNNYEGSGKNMINGKYTSLFGDKNQAAISLSTQFVDGSLKKMESVIKYKTDHKMILNFTGGFDVETNQIEAKMEIRIPLN